MFLVSIQLCAWVLNLDAEAQPSGNFIDIYYVFVFNLSKLCSLQVNGKCLKGLFHEEVVRSLKELPVNVCLVCVRKVTGPSPLRGTIVDNVDTGRSEQAFASRVRNLLFIYIKGLKWLVFLYVLRNWNDRNVYFFWGSKMIDIFWG